MADKSAKVSPTPVPVTRASASKLNTPNRVFAYALGFVGLGAGGVAVFRTHVEAGPVALLAIGLIFMLVALGGRLPTRLKIGENEAEWQDAAGEVMEQVVDASPPSARAEIAIELTRLAEVAPRVAAPALSGLAYDQSAGQIIESAASKVPSIVFIGETLKSGTDFSFDFTMKGTNNRTILVETRASQLSSVLLAALMSKLDAYRRSHPSEKVGLLIVSQRPIPRNAQAILNEDPAAAWVVVSGPIDETLLITSINSLLTNLALRLSHTLKKEPQTSAVQPTSADRLRERRARPDLCSVSVAVRRPFLLSRTA